MRTVPADIAVAVAILSFLAGIAVAFRVRRLR